VLFSPERLTLQPGLATLQSAFTTDYATIMVGGVIASVPVLILFIFAQRFTIEGSPGAASRDRPMGRDRAAGPTDGPQEVP
jgi:ABC-type glycerol-3-phosphate transport system permease component